MECGIVSAAILPVAIPKESKFSLNYKTDPETSSGLNIKQILKEVQD
jgi:hypothetical protein